MVILKKFFESFQVMTVTNIIKNNSYSSLFAVPMKPKQIDTEKLKEDTKRCADFLLYLITFFS